MPFVTPKEWPMARSQLEDELTRLESIIPHLRRDSALGFGYWRSRIARLEQLIDSNPGEARRIRRLMDIFQAIAVDSAHASNRT
jgi:hypothetical protein